MISGALGIVRGRTGLRQRVGKRPTRSTSSLLTAIAIVLALLPRPFTLPPQQWRRITALGSRVPRHRVVGWIPKANR
ncbi:hypothetical protein FA95DRAFT_1374651 [Auriscalpium vulgare]|uniref:Uncharacterized protein n=1 Tax=Auriscalpium vulgare TaxID=40419 RepID=A0ACB8RQQ9_9AGAM|nr:hypothetical protein FA95DRAFT_1374651 [Auriscalpium vulgare]